MPAGHSFVIADDHPLFRGALREALAGIGDVAAIHEAGDFESAKALLLANEDVDLVLLDLSMPGASGSISAVTPGAAIWIRQSSGQNVVSRMNSVSTVTKSERDSASIAVSRSF